MTRMYRTMVLALLGATLLAGEPRPAEAQERLGPIPADTMTDAQRKATAAFRKDRERDPYAFWLGYLRIPEVVVPFLEVQSYVHGVMEVGKGALSEKLTHFAVLIAARQWTQNVIWKLHDTKAVKSGLEQDLMLALAEGRRPPRMTEDEETLYDFCIELQRNQSVSDATYARMLARFGERGIAEATFIQGEYSMMAMFMNVARTPLDPGTEAPMKPFPR